MPYVITWDSGHFEVSLLFISKITCKDGCCFGCHFWCDFFSIESSPWLPGGKLRHSQGSLSGSRPVQNKFRHTNRPQMARREQVQTLSLPPNGTEETSSDMFAAPQMAWKLRKNGGNERALRAIGRKPNSTFTTVLSNTAGICWYYGGWREWASAASDRWQDKIHPFYNRDFLMTSGASLGHS